MSSHVGSYHVTTVHTPSLSGLFRPALAKVIYQIGSSGDIFFFQFHPPIYQNMKLRNSGADIGVYSSAMLRDR